MAEMKVKIYRLMITPETWPRDTQKYKWCFTVPIDELKEKYYPIYRYRLRMERYNRYRTNLRKEAADAGFDLPTDGAWVKFYLPMPVSWSKKKKSKYDFERHQSRPDLTNLFKAFEDALKEEDMKIWDYRTSKFWYSSLKGYIEIHVPEGEVDLAAVAAMQLPAQIRQDPVIY